MSPKRRKLISLLSVLGVLAAGTAALLLLLSFKAQAVVVEEPSDIRIVRTRTLHPEYQVIHLESEGFLTAARSLDIHSPLSGRVVYSHEGLKSGTNVEEGDVLLILDERRARLGFEQARTDLLRESSRFITAAGLSAAEKAVWLEYTRRLESTGPDGLPDFPLMDSRQSLLAATMGVSAAGLALESAALDLLDHRTLAPFDGGIVGDGITEGSMVSPGLPLATLVETGRLEVALPVGSLDMQRISVGDGVLLSRPGEEDVLNASIARIEPSLAAGSQTGQVHATVEPGDSSSWIPGTYVTARIDTGETAKAYRVPRSALSGGRLPLFIDGTLDLVVVNIVAYDGIDVLLTGDFPEGTELVETVLQNPVTGMKLEREAGS